MSRNFLFFAASFLLVSCGTSQEESGPSDFLISNVHIIDVRSGEVLNNRYMVVDSGRIRSITTDVPNGRFRQEVDANGAYAVPGLAEMHAHIPSPPASAELVEETLFLYLANGITTIRGMLGHPYHLELRDKITQGKLDGPRIYTSSPSLNGNSVPTPQEAVAKVTQYASEGYDFLKIHPGIQREVFDSLARTAKRLNIPFAGHVPVDVGIRHALKSGYATIDHVDGYLEGLVPSEEQVDPASNGFFGYNFTSLADTTKIDELVTLTREQGVWIVPTQSLFERWFAPISADSLLRQPEMKYMSPETRANWKRIKDEYMADPGFSPEKWVAFDQIRRVLIYKLYHQGQGLLLGSDAPQLFNVPGFSIHREMDGMERAGLKPAEILKMATLLPAVYFGQEEEFGTLEDGKSADFLLIRSNPFENLDALQERVGVMVRGKWFDQRSIEEALLRIASEYENSAKI